MGIDPAAYVLFVGAALVLLVTPGPAVLFLVSQSLSGGLRAGVASALGLFAGGLVHMVAAILGVSTLLATSAVAFYVLLSGLVRGRLRRSGGRSRWGRYATGSVYVGVGIAAALGGSD